MFRIAVGMVLMFSALPALAGMAAEKHSGRVGASGKISAPVEVSAQLKEGRAEVSVLFAAAARDVEISVKGVDGLVVSSDPQPVSGGAFAKGETTSFPVTYTKGEGRSHLVVAVTGKFDGGKRSSVVSYAVGVPTAGQKRSVGKVQTDSRGKRMKLMPAD